ncbi:binding-protein-dependent transport systems inner membrane component [Xylanimonas cellulosilytica DSM 15894]|uniref:Binding-protein-dependent transport systems inner membrane component n=1 Tax=Xylanimonas cellulosilytica (strain DSM 15894 / JCM 12276 / CECT 5975 / KCTC 9989 / LMG 20990 / NBRC 107835 / XIL07) TaxID=446471 RepID=D1C0G5_XYLCX|nr:ABC transporter permease [Xylanimonas cellulosilytica]ACZ32168.1 binding-protein-dependent transport systems inner membrane component [Xylanimonas cellulosilytica DSM 15894]
MTTSMPTPTADPAVPRRRGWLRAARRTPVTTVLTSVVAAAVLAVVVVWAVGARWIVPDALAQDLVLGVSPAGTPGHLFGTDNLGRDVLALTVAGTLSAVLGPVVIALGSTALGVLLGSLAGWNGGRLDAVVGRWTDLVLALPGLLLAIVVAGILDRGYWVTVALLVLLFSPTDIRLVRAAVSAERGKPYIEAPRVLGIRAPRIVLRHVLPNVRPLVLANLFLNVAYALVAMSSLSFLGLGVSPGSADWGRQLSDARGLLFTNPAAAIVPGIAIIAVSTAVNLLGDRLADRAEQETA